MKHMIVRVFSYFGVGLLSICAGCASDVTVRETLQRPAEINMAGLEKVRVEPITGPGGEVIAARLRPALSQHNFQVIDQTSGSISAQEQSVESLGMSKDQPGSSGSMLRADASIKGNVLRHDIVNEQVTRGTITSNGVSYPAYGREGVANVEISMEVVDLRTRQVIATKSFTVSRSGRTGLSTGNAPALPTQEMFDGCYNEVVSRFMRMVAPYQESIPVKLAKVKDVPANDIGIAQFKAKNYDEAARQFNAGLATAKTLPKIEPHALAGINHNIGIACEFGGHWDNALAWYQQAIAIYPDDSQYAASINRCKQRTVDREALKNQGK